MNTKTTTQELDIRSVSGQEVVAGLLGRELAHRRKHTKGIARKHDDVAGLAVDSTRYMRVRDELDRICAARVLGDADVVIVGRTRSRVVDNILEDAAKADRVVDLGLLCGGEVDALGVTATLDVEDTSVGPDVLVITDEQTPRVGTKSRLSCSRQAEEECNVTLIDADISR